MANWCALCTADIPGTPLREPLGRDGALVNVCTSCATEHPRSGRYSFDDASHSRERFTSGHSLRSERGGSKARR